MERIKGYVPPAIYAGKLRRAARRHANYLVQPEAFVMFSDADKALNENRNEDALNHFDAYLKVVPDSADAWQMRGWTLIRLGRPDDALASYNRAIQMVKDDPWFLHERGNAYYNAGKYREAAHEYFEAASLFTRSRSYTMVHYWTAKTLAGQRAEADRVIRAYMQQTPYDRTEVWFYTLARFSEGKLTADALLQSANMPYRKLQAHWLVAIDALSRGDRAAAAEHLRQAAAVNAPDNYDYYAVRADQARLVK